MRGLVSSGDSIAIVQSGSTQIWESTSEHAIMVQKVL